MGHLKFDITGDNSAVLKAFKGVQDGVTQTARIVDQQGQSIENVFNRIKSVASVAFAGFTAKEIFTTLANVRGNFQQFEIAFETMLHSGEKAKAMIADLAKLAATTPFDMKGVVAGAKQLLAYGFAADQITDTMRRLGDISAGLGLNLQDLTWLYGTTMVQGRLFTRDLMQFTSRGIPMTEALAKQFGVTENKVSDLVTAGKIGFPEVEKAIKSMTDEGGQFGGLMEKQSHSITGQISNIEDTIEMAINDLGTQTEGIMNDALDITSTIIDHWKEIGEVILASASAIGLYKAMAVGVAAFDSATANVGYAAELSALDALLPMKEEAKKTDLEEAVAKGELTAAQAELVASKREEVKAYAESLAVKAKNAQDELANINDEVAALKNRDDEAQRTLDYYQEQYERVLQLGDCLAIETAENNLNTAASEKNATAKALQAGQSKQAAAAKAADTATTEANTAAQGLNTASTARDTAAKGIWAQVTLLCKRAQEAWNSSMFASPLFWIAATIAGVTYAIYKLATAESTHEAAIRKTNEAWDEFNKKLEERSNRINSLIRTIQDETATEYQKAEAYDTLSKLAPEITEKYSQAALASLEMSKAQKEVNETLDEAKYDEAIRNVEDLKSQIDSAKILLQEAYQEGNTDGDAYVQGIKLRLEILNTQLDVAASRLAKISSLREEAAENEKPIEVRLKEAQENVRVRQNILDFYDEAMTLANDWQAANETINYVTGETRLDAFIAKTERELEDLRIKIKQNPADVNLRLQEEEKTKALNNILGMKRDWKATGATTIPLIFKADWYTAKQSLNQAETKASALANSGSTESYAKAYSDAQKAYNAAKRKVAAMEKNKYIYTATQYETATQDLKAKKDAFSKLGGDVSGKSVKAADTDRKKRIKEEKESVNLQEELNSRLKSLQQKNIDDELALQEEGTKKKLAQIDNDYKKRLDEIKKQETEFKKKNKEAGTKTGKNGLTDKQSKALDDARVLAKKDYDKQVEEAYAEELAAMRDYLKSYGSLMQQREAIEGDYNDRIKKAKTEGEKLSLQKEKETALSNFEFSSISKGIDWKTLLGGVGNISTEMLKPMLEQLEAYTKTDDFSKADTDTQQKTVDLIKELKQYVGDQSTTWEQLSTAIQDFNDAVAEYDEAVKNEKQAKAQADQAKKDLDDGKISQDVYDEIVANLKAASEKAANAKADMEKKGRDVNDKTDDVKNYSSKLTQVMNKDGGTWKSVDGFSDVQGAVGNIDSLKGAFDAAAPAIGEGVGTEISGTIGSALTSIGGGMESILSSGIGQTVGFVAMIPKMILQLADTIKNFVTGILDSFSELLKFEWLSDLVNSILDAIWNLIDTVLDLPENIFHLLEAIIVKGIGGLINNIIGRLGNILSFGALSSGGPASWFMNSNAKEVAEKTEKLTESNEKLQTSVDNLKDELSKQSGFKAINTAKQAKEDQETINRQTMEILQTQMGYHGAHHSNAKNWNLKSDDYASINQTLANYRQKNPTADTTVDSVNSLNDIYKLTPEQMQYIQTYNIKMWDKMLDQGDYDKSEYWEKYADLAGKLDEITDSLKESLTGTTFDNMKSNFVSNLMDMSKTAQDFSDDFSEMLMQSVLNAKISDMMDEELQAFYKKWASYAESDNVLDDSEINELKQEWQGYVQKGMQLRDQAASITGYDGTSASQNTSSTGVSSMTQDQANELNGRFTALQIAGESINNNIIQVVTSMQDIATIGSSTNGAVLDMRNMMIMTNSYLEDMVRYAKLTYNDFGYKMDNMYEKLKAL